MLHHWRGIPSMKNILSVGALTEPFAIGLCGSNDYNTKFWCRNRPGDNPRDVITKNQGYNEQGFGNRLPDNFQSSEALPAFVPGLTRNEGTIPGIGIATSQGEHKQPLPLGPPPLPPGPHPSLIGSSQQQGYQQQYHQGRPQQMPTMANMPHHLQLPAYHHHLICHCTLILIILGLCKCLLKATCHLLSSNARINGNARGHESAKSLYGCSFGSISRTTKQWWTPNVSPRTWFQPSTNDAWLQQPFPTAAAAAAAFTCRSSTEHQSVTSVDHLL